VMPAPAPAAPAGPLQSELRPAGPGPHHDGAFRPAARVCLVNSPAYHINRPKPAAASFARQPSGSPLRE
jgi:hypothetical protein